MRRGAVNTKFCPKCGAPNDLSDTYCTRCRFNFSGRRKSKGANTILIVLLLAIAGWIVIRLYLKKPILPTEFVNIIKNIQNVTFPKTG